MAFQRRGDRQSGSHRLGLDERRRATTGRRVPPFVRGEEVADLPIEESSPPAPSAAASAQGGAVARRVRAPLSATVDRLTVLQLRHTGRVHARLRTRDRPRRRQRGAAADPELPGRAEGAAARLPHPVRDRPRRPGAGGTSGLACSRGPRQRPKAADPARSDIARRTRACTRQGAVRRRHADDDRTQAGPARVPCSPVTAAETQPAATAPTSSFSLVSGPTPSARTTAAAARAPPGWRKLSQPG